MSKQSLDFCDLSELEFGNTNSLMGKRSSYPAASGIFNVEKVNVCF